MDVLSGSDLLFERARLPDGRCCSLSVSAGRFVAIEPEGAPARPGARVDLGYALVTPGLIDGHIHLDTTFFGDRWQPHRPCREGFNVAERVAIQKELVAGAAPVGERASALIERMISRGTSHLRTHVEIDLDFKLRHLEAIVDIKERYRHSVSVEIVGFARGAILRKGTLELLEESLRQGARIIGGVDPAGYEGDIAGHLDVVFALADRHGVGIDLHLHEFGFAGPL